MNHIKDQDPSENQDLVSKIVEHAVEQVNFTIRCLSKRNTVHMLMQCEDTMTDLIPIVKLIASNDSQYRRTHDLMLQALNAVQTGEEPQPIEFN